MAGEGTCGVSDEIILETEDLTKEFAGFVAVNGVNLRVERGTIHALIGPNGAGKTTCFNLLTKFLQPTRGPHRLQGRATSPRCAPADVARLGMVRSFQISAVFPHLTVLENVRIALQRQRGGSFDFWRSSRVLDALNERALSLIADVGLSDFVASRRRSNCPMAASARSRSRPRSRSIPRCCCSTSRPPAWATRTSTASRALIKSRRRRPHRADGRAQSQRRRQPLRPHHRADARPRAGGGRLRDGVEQSRRCAKPIWGPAMLDAQRAAARGQGLCRPGTASRTFCMA